MTTRHFDIKPVKPCAVHHRHFRRFIRSLPSRAVITPTEAVLVVVDKSDPCLTRIVREDLWDDLLGSIDMTLPD